MSLAAPALPAVVEPRTWEILLTGAGEPKAAFLRGHLDITALARSAEGEIIKAFASFSRHLASDVMEILDEAGGAGIRHDWLRMTGEGVDVEFFEFCQSAAADAFPVTAVRFQ